MSALVVRDLQTEFRAGDGWLRAVDGVSFELQPGEILGLVGESGCGKTTTAFSIMRLIPENARIAGGEVWLGDDELVRQDEAAMQHIRGRRIAMIFQDPMTSLDPAFTVGSQLIETIREHLNVRHAEARTRALELFRQVGIPGAHDRLNAYPHQFSGGMRQRIALAIAISCHPQVLIADEPTTALDVTIQAQILSLIRALLVHERQTGVLLITHDLGVVAQVCDRVAVMYAGEVVEMADTVSLFTEPRHPYTKALLKSLPTNRIARGRLPAIPGTVPNLAELPSGCRFHPRCADAMAVCAEAPPPEVVIDQQRTVRCVLYE